MNSLGASPNNLERQLAIRDLAKYLLSRHGYIGGEIPQELLEPFFDGEEVISPGRAGGKSILVREGYAGKYLVYR